MATFISTSKFERWWRKAQAWFATQFASIHVDLTPVEDKLDDIEEAVENIHVDSESADMVKDFFGIVKDGDTVKVVTEDGGEEVVVPVGLMDEDDVYDHLEDVAVLLGGITAEQAASITAATRAIIHGGSGSGEGGEGGSGSGSGE